MLTDSPRHYRRRWLQRHLAVAPVVAVAEAGKVDKPGPQVMAFTTPQAWRAWLEKNYSLQEGIFLRIYKKDSGVQTITYAEALDEALCFGWIDGIKKSYDEVSWIQKFTPRRKRSVWSARNKEHIDRLSKAGKMRDPGLKEVDAAKADGRWEAAYASHTSFAMPDYFAAELEEHPQAKAFFDTLNKQNKYAMFFRLQTSKRPETRERWLKKFIAMLERGEKFYP